MRRTDLAVEIVEKRELEGVLTEEIRVGDIRISKVTVEKSGEKLLKKPSGRYYSLHCDCTSDKNAVSESIRECLSELLEKLPDDAPIVVAGLGNINITPDSLGVITAEKIPATAHLVEQHSRLSEIMRPVFVFSLGVMAKTGVESAEHLEVIVKRLRPTAVIVIDSLACRDAGSLASTIQLTDTGISLGSGVGNNRKEISPRQLGVPVVAIGVPTVIDADNIKSSFEPLMITPRSIDAIIKTFSDAISHGINVFLNPKLSEEEINALLF